MDCRNAAAISSHTFLPDRHASGMLDLLGRALRRTGYATLTFDYSGYGASGDETITFDSLTEDFCSVSGWPVGQGFMCQTCVGHEFGAAVALRSRSPVVRTHVLASLALSSPSYDWNLVFPNTQFSDPKHHGATTVLDDSESVYRQFMASKRTLVDMSVVSGEDALYGFSVLALIMHDSFGKETGLLDHTRGVFHLLSDGSLVKMTVAPDGIAGRYTPIDDVPIINEAMGHALAASGSVYLPTLADVTAKWVSRWAPVNR